MKTLTEVEPRIAVSATNTPGDADSLFKITLPGSYYLTGNITGEAGKYGIEIEASGVTLDLKGFDLAGVPDSVAGVSVNVGGLTNIAVVNGSVRNWGYLGVSLGAATNCRVADLLASGNAGNGGIYVGSGSTVSNCAATSNSAGIFAAPNCTVSNCSVNGNSVGIVVQEGSVVSNCSAGSNVFGGIQTYRGCALLGCSAFNTLGDGFNPGDGIFADDGSTLSNCVAYNNTGNGIRTAYGCSLLNCSAHSNFGDAGIYAFGEGCTLSNCAALLNFDIGIIVGSGSTVADCNAAWNIGDGIVCASRSVVSGNSCWKNGNFGGAGAGIHATGIGNRIEGNHCTGADLGIDVDAAGNIIIKNTCSGNTTNWDIAANNVCGPILDRTAPASAAILGNSAPSSLGSTDPNANFTY